MCLNQLAFPSMRNTKLNSHSDQIRQRLRGHLAHDLAPMDLQGHLADSQHCRSPLVEQATDDEGKHFTFTWSQPRQTLFQLRELHFPLPIFPVLRESRADCGQRRPGVYRLLEEVHSTCSHGANCAGNIRRVADTDDRRSSLLLRLPEQLEATDVWQMEVKNQARDAIVPQISEVLTSGPETDRFESERTEKFNQSFSKIDFIVDQVDHLSAFVRREVLFTGELRERRLAGAGLKTGWGCSRLHRETAIEKSLSVPGGHSVGITACIRYTLATLRQCRTVRVTRCSIFSLPLRVWWRVLLLR